MSSHCNRYPKCGCSPEIGSKCHLPEGHPSLSKMETVGIIAHVDHGKTTLAVMERLKDRGYEPIAFPINDSPSLKAFESEMHGLMIEESKRLESEYYDRLDRNGSSRKPHRKHATNYTPPKKKRNKNRKSKR